MCPWRCSYPHSHEFSPGEESRQGDILPGKPSKGGPIQLLGPNPNNGACFLAKFMLGYP